ncbi:hypothetical protein [Nocardia camponoti]|nr:hypothetical protein [Nocardia camponoti]
MLVAAAPAVAETPSYQPYLDLPVTNGEGEFGGGLHPALPLDIDEALTALTQARADGIAPHRYSALLHQYWFLVSVTNAHIDPRTWSPTSGVAANAAAFAAVYVNYFRIAAARPDFYWAGLAGIAGASFASGFFDIGDAGALIDLPGIHALGSAVADLVATTPAPLRAEVPADLAAFVAGAPRLTGADLAWYQTRLMIMQKHIFTDLVPMHEAYVAGGMAAIDEMAAAGLLTPALRAAWAGIDSGTRQGRIDAIIAMTDREQNVIVADQWDETTSARDGMGRVLTYVSTLAGKAAVPGVHAPGVYAPVTVTAQVGPDIMTLRAPLPAFNWADRAARWDYLNAELLPRHLDVTADENRARAVYLEPFATKITRGRLVARLPDMLADLTTQWQVSRS